MDKTMTSAFTASLQLSASRGGRKRVESQSNY
jgi:hypothetical protein